MSGKKAFLFALMLAGCSGQTPAGMVDPGTSGDDGAVSGDDGGVGGGGSDPFAGPTVCTSGNMWTLGDRGSQLMHPGRACIDCHDQNGGPALKVGGTVYPTGHEPDDCDGVDMTGYNVVITDATGTDTTVPVNSAGNFVLRSRTPFAFPITAKVVSPTGTERAMTTAQSTADCNSCHTEAGANGAPGRIVAP